MSEVPAAGDAKFPTLPKQAIAADHIHFTVPLSGIAPLLIQLLTPAAQV